MDSVYINSADACWYRRSSDICLFSKRSSRCFLLHFFILKWLISIVPNIDCLLFLPSLLRPCHFLTLLFLHPSSVSRSSNSLLLSFRSCSSVYVPWTSSPPSCALLPQPCAVCRWSPLKCCRWWVFGRSRKWHLVTLSALQWPPRSWKEKRISS